MIGHGRGQRGRRRIGLFAFATLGLLVGGCDRPASSSTRATVNPQTEPGGFVSRTHGFFVRFVDDWRIREDADGALVLAEKGGAETGGKTSGATAGAATDADADQALIEAWVRVDAVPAGAQSAADAALARWQPETGFTEFARGQERLRGGESGFVIFGFERDGTTYRGVIWERGDLKPPLVLTGVARADRFAEYASGFRLTAQSIAR